MTILKGKTNRAWPTVGNVGDRQIPRWGPASKCTETCPMWDDCEYAKREMCTLEAKYMDVVFNMLISENKDIGITDQLDDIELWRVGFHLIPLYHQLIRLKKVAYTVDQRLTQTDKQGKLSIHPVFKEIRAVLQSISKEIKELKLNEKWKKKFGKMGGPGAGPDIEDLFEHGDPSYYDKMAKDDRKKIKKA